MLADVEIQYNYCFTNSTSTRCRVYTNIISHHCQDTSLCLTPRVSESHGHWSILASSPGSHAHGVRYPGHSPRGVMHSEVFWPWDPRSHAHWGILVRVPGESCAVKYPDHGTRGVMHTEVSWSGSPGSHAQWGILASSPGESCTVK